MVNIKDIFDLIGIASLIIQSPINVFWREYSVGINASQANCYNQTVESQCIFNGVAIENKQDKFITIVMVKQSVSFLQLTKLK